MSLPEEYQSQTPRPMPPDDVSIRSYVERQWKEIIASWQRGWHAESSIEQLENYLEHHRTLIFEQNNVDGNYDWRSDWRAAKVLHDFQTDFVRNRRAYNEGLRTLWAEWYDRNSGSLTNLSLEALRSMVLINGAAILACLTLLSGQVEHPNPSAILAAKVMLMSSILSMLLMGGGHMVGSMRLISVIPKVRGSLVGNVRHHRLYSIGRYLSRYLDAKIQLSNALIYSSIFVFSFSAIICGLIVTFDAAM